MSEIKLQNEFEFLGDIPKTSLNLRDKYTEPPFSVLDSHQGSWQNRKQAWKSLGIEGEIGRKSELCLAQSMNKYDYRQSYTGTSGFDEVLAELMCRWFCPEGGCILDPFAGGPVRGIVAHYLGYHYDGIELRQEQVDSNQEQALDILPLDNQPQWYVGDSNKVLDNKWLHKFDFILSCPPYANLEIYSDLIDDISNMEYPQFLEIYRSIIRKSLALLGLGSFACFVVGEIRDKQGYYYDFVGDTKRAFIDNGARLYNDCVYLENGLNTAAMRASKQFEASKKLVKIHQNVLVFKKVA